MCHCIIETDALNATLYTVAVTWYTAENYCSKEGSNLLNLTQPINLYLSFVKTPWLSSGVTKFWTGHSSLEIFENLEIAKKYDIAEMEINKTGCVYVIVENRYQNFPIIQLGIDSCNNTKDGFICLKPTQDMYFDRSPNFIYTSSYLKYDGQPYTISECEDECKEMMKNGYACIGFNYNKANSSCQFKETMFGGSYTIRYDSDWISVDYTHHHVTNNEGVTALSYLYDRNDQATLPSEKTIIRGSYNTSDYPAATNNINTDTSFVVTINEGVTALSYLYDRNVQATLPSEKTIIRGSENTSDYPAATNNINTDTSFLGKTFTVGACVVAAVAGVVVLGATVIGIMKIKQKGRNSSIICSSHNVEDSLSNGKHEVSGLTSLNNFLNKPPGNYQVGRLRNKPHNNQH
ncbi:unnamed protein product [Mytilus edulis]|uniref:Apple domain-containing protein n=1 Tax=Mytilus edulis TaxID=6550 RepID=A0A8S3Q2P1_MYTED|nr:unnamed protein product [Mytilus edulis]